MNLKLTNNTKDTVLIYPFKQIQTSISGFSVSFSYPDANYDYYDTLLFIPAKKNLEFNFIILVSKFNKEKFENPYIYSFFSFNVIPSLDTIRKNNRKKEEVYLYKNYLITSHNLIEVCSEFRELSLFLFKKE
ncbi:MAG: hypothetical protein J0M18_17625 [Ignavibacteria bacterium]|nr:hypothetical protein [Ignavibacteria bacterium]